MQVSKLSLSSNVQSQSSSKAQILRWMQEHPQHLTYTNTTRLAKMMTELPISISHIKHEINAMVNNQMISRYGTKYNSQFLINYLHKNIPPDVLAHAPQFEQEQVRKIKAGLGPRQELSTEGCIITHPEPDSKPEKAEPEQAKPEVKVENDGNNISVQVNINLRK